MAGEVAPFVSDEDEGAQVEAAADGMDDVSEMASVPAVPWWSWLLDRIMGRAGLDSDRLERLDQAIARHPDAPANYVLRGELYLRAGEPELAMADFETAFDLASSQCERDDWGLLSQAMRDQAECDLERARRRLKKQ